MTAPDLSWLAGRVGVVTDSVALGPTAAERGIIVVPVSMVVGEDCFEDGTPEASEALKRALTERQRITTSRPAPERFVETYQKMADAGAVGIVSVHMSSRLSGTYDSAASAARRSSVPVKVIDTRQLAMGVGFTALAATQRAADGADLDDVAKRAQQCAESVRSIFYVDTLEYLRRGGRIGAASALLGSALAVKPLLGVKDGAIEVLEKVRTSAKALARLEALAVEAAADLPVDISVQFLTSQPQAEALADRLRDRIPHLEDLVLTPVGPALAAHSGPGVLAVVVAPRAG